MDNFLLSLNVVLPSFIFIAIGAVLKLCKILNDNAIVVINKCCFKVFLPILLFNSIYKTNIATAFNGKLLLYCVLATIILFALMMTVIPFVEKKKVNRGVIIQAVYRSNFVLFGLPVVASLFPNSELGGVALTMGVVVALFNATSVVALEVFRDSDEKIKVGKIVKSVLLNPLIIGSALGILFMLCKIKLPTVLASPIKSIADLSTPISLMALGGAFKFSQIKGNAIQLSFCVVCKLVLTPLLVTGVAIALGFRGIELATVFVFSSAPTAVATYTMAQQTGANADLASEIIVFSAGLSVVTMFCGVLILTSLGLLF